MSVHIRLYHPEDRAQCLQIFHGNCPQYFDPAEEALFTQCLDRLDQGLVIHEQAKASAFYVLEQNEIILACGGYYIAMDEAAAAMAWGMVDNSHHKEGLGSALLDYRIHHLRQYYPNHLIRLDTSQHTYPFFERFGFEVTTVTKDAYGPGLDRVDMTINEAE